MEPQSGSEAERWPRKAHDVNKGDAREEAESGLQAESMLSHIQDKTNREIARRVIIEGESQVDIAAEMGVTKSAIGGRISRAIRQMMLTIGIKERGVKIPPGK